MGGYWTIDDLWLAQYSLRSDWKEWCTSYKIIHAAWERGRVREASENSHKLKLGESWCVWQWSMFTTSSQWSSDRNSFYPSIHPSDLLFCKSIILSFCPSIHHFFCVFGDSSMKCEVWCSINDVHFVGICSWSTAVCSAWLILFN